MALESVVGWTRSTLSYFTGGDIPVTSVIEAPLRARVALPLFDVFEDEREVRVVVEVPGATAGNTQLAWNDFDTLSVYVQRSAARSEQSDWYREIVLSPEADGTKARSTLRDGVLTVRIPKRPTLSSKLAPVYAAS